MYRNGQLWTTLGTASVADGTPVRDAAAWFVINVSNSGKGPTANIAEQGYVAGPDSSHLLYPALAVNAAGHASMVFTLTGPEFSPAQPPGNLARNPPSICCSRATHRRMGLGLRAESPALGRLSAAAVDSNGNIWLATEMIPGGIRKVSANWGTFISRSP